MTFSNFLEKLFNNWQAKLFSVAVALLLYFGFQIISVQTKDLAIPLEIHEAGNFILRSNAPSYIRIEAKGTEDEIAELQKEDIYAYIDTSFVTKNGVSVLPVRLNLINDAAFSKSLDVQVFPDTVQLEFEENIVKWVPVIPLFKGKLEEGYQKDSWTCSPSDIKITGPKSIIDATSFIYVDNVELNNRSSDFITEVQPLIQNERISIHDIEGTFLISVEISPIISSNFFEIEVPVDSLPREFSLSKPLHPVKIELSGEMNKLNKYVPNDSIIKIDFSKIKKVGTYSIPFTVEIPADYTFTPLSFNEIEVEVIDVPEVEINTELITNNLIQNLINQGAE